MTVTPLSVFRVGPPTWASAPPRSAVPVRAQFRIRGTSSTRRVGRLHSQPGYDFLLSPLVLLPRAVLRGARHDGASRGAARGSRRRRRREAELDAVEVARAEREAEEAKAARAADSGGRRSRSGRMARALFRSCSGARWRLEKRGARGVVLHVPARQVRRGRRGQRGRWPLAEAVDVATRERGARAAGRGRAGDGRPPSTNA